MNQEVWVLYDIETNQPVLDPNLGLTVFNDKKLADSYIATEKEYYYLVAMNLKECEEKASSIKKVKNHKRFIKIASFSSGLLILGGLIGYIIGKGAK